MMKTQPTANWKVIMAAALVTSMTMGAGCTEEEVNAVLSGVQVATEGLNDSDEVSFRDWLSGELDD